MARDVFADILAAEGFKPLGELHLRLRMQLWWNPERAVLLMTIAVGATILLKGSKSYYLLSITEEGETYARDIPGLHDWLESHFEDVNITCSVFRDIPATLADAHLRRRIANGEAGDPVQQLGLIQSQLDESLQTARSLQTMIGLDDGDDDLLRSHLQSSLESARREGDVLESQRSRLTERVELIDRLQHAYQRDSSAALLAFTINSNLQQVDGVGPVRDVIRSIVKELADLHRFQVTQKLNGGRLQIHVAESREPLLAWIEQWMGGALNPTQFERLGPAFNSLKATSVERTMVTPKTDVTIGGHEREHRKLIGARAASTLLTRIDRRDRNDQPDREFKECDLPLRLGRRTDGRNLSPDDVVLPLRPTRHGYASGITGSGKSYFTRVVTEEAAMHDGLGILVLDPRNQSAGLLVREDRTEILDLYPSFGMKPDDARGFDFKYYGLGQDIGTPLPNEPRTLAVGRSIVSFKGLDDAKRCGLFAEILDRTFECLADAEVDGTRLLIVVEEAHRFTKKRVAPEAKAAAAQAEIVLDRVIREGRKFGVCVYICSQTIRDFAYESASIRQNTDAKAFLRNSDREVDYAADFIGDGRRIMALTPGQAILHNPDLGTVMVQVRPPMSKVWEFSPEQTRQIAIPRAAVTRSVSTSAEELLDVMRAMMADVPAEEMKITAVATRSGISSRRRLLALLNELEQAQLIRTRRLARRGSPRVVEVISSVVDENADTIRTQGDET